MNGSPRPDPTLRTNYERVLERIREACRRSGRDPGSVRLLAVSKTFEPERVLALASLGQRAFGENYLQEALQKIEACRDGRSSGVDERREPAARPSVPSLEWHFIGPIQSNKTRPIAAHFDWVHSIDREKIAARLGEQRPDGMAPLDCCVQVNVSGETSKSGCAPGEAIAVARAIVEQPRLRLRGVMAIPEPSDDESLQRRRFASARATLDLIRADLTARAPGAAGMLDTLSMGMSADLESAIAEGATIVRIGSALFGSRPPKP